MTLQSDSENDNNDLPSTNSKENKENTSTSIGPGENDSTIDESLASATQTRFSFYDAAEVQSQQVVEDEDPKEIQRKSYYSAAGDVLESSKTTAREAMDVLARRHRRNNSLGSIPRARKKEDTVDILKSLQETEDQRNQILTVDAKPGANRPVAPRQRMTPSSRTTNRPPLQKNERPDDEDDDDDASNPYEDAIKEALDLLRRHRSPQRSESDQQPAVVISGGPLQPSSPEDSDILRSQTPKQQDRLLQLRQEDESDHDSSYQPPTTGDDDDEEEDSEEAMLEGDLTDLFEEQKVKAKERQERMAEYATRLQEFKSTLTGSQDEELDQQDGEDTIPSNDKAASETDLVSLLSQSTNEREEEVQRGVEKVLLAILERAYSSRGRAEANNTLPQESMNDALLKAMDELLSGKSTEGDHNRTSDTMKAERASVVDDLLAEVEERQEEKKQSDYDKIATIIEEDENVVDDDDEYTKNDKYSFYTEEEGNEYTDDDDTTMDRVLGPLSQGAGGTTGVVLDIDDDVVTTDPTTVSNAVSDLSQGLSEKNDKYATEERDAGEQDISDKEATDLMRTLCAHLLPYGVDQFKRRSQSIPPWDENNPNEAGYRIIRLSKSQLRRVEFAFETMINNLKRNTERRLSSAGTGSQSENDASFYKDLQEAERLLDSQEEGLYTTKVENDEKSIDLDDHDSAISVETTDSQCHPDFPGIKMNGKGEMGDLEYFHLPIVFKSHVTGFEPTKDLELEPGNVIAGQYLVENELGSAAFSTAYRCIDLSSEMDAGGGHEEVCLKVIKNTKDFFDQSLDEIKILELLRQTGKVDENHIVRMKTFFYYREHLIIVTELLRQNLYEFGKFIMENNEEPYFTLSRLAYITRQCLISLRFVHSLGLVHSDVKPENILLGSYSRAQIKLIDFGSSCYLTDRQSSYIQSRSYRAPEVVLGLPYDGKIDVWSLGCVVAEMFTGEVTFQNDSVVTMLSRIEAICGPFPRHMVAQGRQSGRFFTKSGLLYEVVDTSEQDDDHDRKATSDPGDNGKEKQYDIFQPKSTGLSSRLGFDADLMDDFKEANFAKIDSKRRKKIMFTDFVSKLLTIDPDGRPTAAEALNHPWMQYAASLEEEDIKYPSS